MLQALTYTIVLHGRDGYMLNSESDIPWRYDTRSYDTVPVTSMKDDILWRYDTSSHTTVPVRQLKNISKLIPVVGPT